ncbi:hypothetical protein, partial [Propionibacterium freudenreichii]|uniref:hypothetical protein n=1 Tax=Propionibacterium freudenreichii TaxID=1744 RepID=UPI002550935B
PAFEAVEISDLSLNDHPTRAIRTLHRSDPRRPGVLLRRYDTTDVLGCGPVESVLQGDRVGREHRYHHWLA